MNYALLFYETSKVLGQALDYFGCWLCSSLIIA